MRKRKRPQRSPDDMRDWYAIGVIAVMTALSVWVPMLSKVNSGVASSTVASSRSRRSGALIFASRPAAATGLRPHLYVR